LGAEGRRKLKLRLKTNDELFALYDSDLILRVHNSRTLTGDRQLLGKFHDYLGNYPPSPELAKGFLSQYADRKPRTLARYSSTIKLFMRWCGEPLDDFKVKVPRVLPPYTQDSDVEKLFTVIKNKQTHKVCVALDSLLTELALKTGMRRSELANLEVRDIYPDLLIVRKGKGGKDRVIPLLQTVATRLQNFTKGMSSGDKVFKLKATSIGNKIKRFAKKAGLNDFHTHTMRHKFATDLLDRGANLKQVQELLGHSRLDKTEVYLSITDKGLREAISTLEAKPQKVNREHRRCAENEVFYVHKSSPKWLSDIIDKEKAEKLGIDI